MHTNDYNREDDSEGKMFVGGLAWDSTEHSIKDYFEKFGAVVFVNLKRNKDDPQKHRGFCFVKFTTAQAVEDVLSHPDPHFIDGSKVDPKSACPAGVKPGERTKKIFVGGLADFHNEEQLSEYFGKFGEIRGKIELPMDRSTGKRRGFCFIEFANELIVDRIVKQKHHEVAGKRIETKRFTKQQPASNAMVQQIGSRVTSQTYNALGGMVQALPTAYSAQQLAALSQYAQPVIYIHPDSLSATYPGSVVGNPGLPVAMATAGGYQAMQTLYQPYTATASHTAAVRQSSGSAYGQRHTPYSTKKQ